MTSVFTRREFLKRSVQIAPGLVLLSSLPSVLKGKTLSGAPAYVDRACYTMGTVVTLSAYGERYSHVNQAITKAFQEIQRIDNLMSLYKPESRLSLINHNAGKAPVRVERDLINIIVSAKHYYAVTRGEFDITIEPLMKLWGFRKEQPTLDHVPSDKELQSRLDAVGFNNIVVDEREQSVGLINPHSQLDLGGIAVGYSVDRAISILKNEGITSAFLNHSGDAFALGAPENTEGWEIGIPNPHQPNEMMASYIIHDQAVSTSGSYEKYVTVNAERFGHILNPQTGKPGKSMQSATVFAPTSLEADALSTGLFCMDVTVAQQIVSGLPHMTLVVL
ncbi:MAG: FAD:protein FMN transferase [Ignavibacteriales bacterium]|nr:FAD:protein FMN transferase [Ignavibacteriales bacterium]